MSTEIPGILVKILNRKQEEIDSRQRYVTIADLKRQADNQTVPRGFSKAIHDKLALCQSAVIAEIKKASPSKGIIRENFEPEMIARSYEEGGAACLSVLTDKDFFRGHEDYLVQARNAVSIPVIRKDFLIAPYQIYEARAIGADCVLLIVAAFVDDIGRLKELYSLAIDLGMDVLVEVHNESELAHAMALGIDLVGINNRNLHTFETSLETTTRLTKIIPDTVTIVTESGIHGSKDVALMRDYQVDAFLVGEAFMRADNPGEALKALFFS